MSRPSAIPALMICWFLPHRTGLVSALVLPLMNLWPHWCHHVAQSPPWPPPLHHSLKAPLFWPVLASPASWPPGHLLLPHWATEPVQRLFLPPGKLFLASPSGLVVLSTQRSLLSSLPPSSLELPHPSSVLSPLACDGAFTILPSPAANLVIFNGKLIMY